MYSPEGKPLPRWILIPTGVLFLLISILSIIVSITLILAPNVPPTILTVSLGCVFFAGSLWAFYLSLRLIFVNPKGKNKYFSSTSLKIFAIFSYPSFMGNDLMGIAKYREKEQKINIKKNRTISQPNNKLDILKGLILLLFVAYLLFEALNTNTAHFGRTTVHLSTDPVLYFLSVGFLLSAFVGCIIWIVVRFKD